MTDRYTDEQIEAARVVLERLSKPEAVKQPWLSTLKVPLLMIAGVLLAISAAVVVLVGVVANFTNDTEQTNQITACRNLFGAEIADAQADMFRQLGTMQTDFNQALVNLSQRAPDGTRPDLTYLREAIEATNTASVSYAASLDARNAWVAAGTPLPCPLDARSIG